METKVIIRSAGIEDLGTVGLLAHAIWPAAYGHILSAEQLQYMLQLIYSPASLTDQLLRQQHRFLLAELNDEAVGFASFSESNQPGIYKLHKLYVRTGIQGKGLGKALVHAVITAIQPANPLALRLNMNRQNTAKTFYEKLGFTVIREEDIDIGNGYFMNDYVMEKKLKARLPAS